MKFVRVVSDLNIDGVLRDQIVTDEYSRSLFTSCSSAAVTTGITISAVLESLPKATHGCM